MLKRHLLAAAAISALLSTPAVAQTIVGPAQCSGLYGASLDSCLRQHAYGRRGSHAGYYRSGWDFLNSGLFPQSVRSNVDLTPPIDD